MARKKILVVDDELDMRVFVTTLVETAGYRPCSAANGEEGLRLARQERPSLIVMDIMMPKESGINLYRELKKDPELQTIPVIILSAVARKTFTHSQRTLDAHQGIIVPEPAAYVEKPPEPQELLGLINDLLQPASAGG